MYTDNQTFTHIRTHKLHMLSFSISFLPFSLSFLPLFLPFSPSSFVHYVSLCACVWERTFECVTIHQSCFWQLSSRKLEKSSDLATTVCGTPSYISPEQLQYIPYCAKVPASCSTLVHRYSISLINPTVLYILKVLLSALHVYILYIFLSLSFSFSASAL